MPKTTNTGNELSAKVLSSLLTLAMLLALLLSFAPTVRAAAGDYHPGDIAIINAMIDQFDLGWEKAPADGSYVPKSWNPSQYAGVFWLVDLHGNRVNRFSLNDSRYDLTGTLDVTGLTHLTNLNCSSNSLTELKVAGLDKLQYLYCDGNNLASLDLSGCTRLEYVNCSNNLMTSTSAITGTGDILAFSGWDNVFGWDYIFSPQRSPAPLLSLDDAPERALPHLAEGYSDRSRSSSAINNTGSAVTGTLTIALSGKDKTAFQLAVDSMATAAAAGASITKPGIAAGGRTTFMILPASGLAAGTYTATLIVTGANGGSASYTLTQTVRKTYAITVKDGTSPSAAGYEGQKVTIIADAAPVGKVFDRWTTASSGVTFANAAHATTFFTMPAGNVTVTASYKDKASSPSVSTYAVTVSDGTGSGSYAAGATVEISAKAAPEGKVFDKWTAKGVTLVDSAQANTSFTMPSSAVTIAANYKDAPKEAASSYAVTVNSGTGSGSYTAGSTVEISAKAAPEGKAFDKWTSASLGVTFADASEESTSFVMPANTVTIAALYKDLSPSTYTVTVNGGTGSGSYAAGSTLNIVANVAPAGKVFDKWTVSGATLVDATKANTSLIMPSNAVTITAMYRDVSTTSYAVTINSSYADTSGAGHYAQAETVAIAAGSRSNYRFAGWAVTSLGVTLADVDAPTTTFVMPAHAVTITATWAYVGGDTKTDGKDDDSSAPSTKPDETKPDETKPDEAETTPAPSEPAVRDESVPIVLTIDSQIVRQGDKTLSAPPVPPQIINSRTMLPFRYLIQTLLGGEVNWEEATRSIDATVDGVRFRMTIGDKNIVIDGAQIVFDQAPVIVENYTLVPLRVFEKAVQSISWDNASRSVTIVK